MNRSLKNLIYITAWILVWLSFSLIINAGFLAINLYAADSKGALLTLILSGIISIAGGSSLYSEVFTNESQ